MPLMQQQKHFEQHTDAPGLLIFDEGRTMSTRQGAFAIPSRNGSASHAFDDVHLKEEPPPEATVDSPPLTSGPAPASTPIAIHVESSPDATTLLPGWDTHSDHRTIHQYLEEHDQALLATTSLEDPSWLLDERCTSELRLCASACPRARWIPDRDATACQYPGCNVQFGYLNLPGIVWSTRSSQSTIEDKDRRRLTMTRTSTTPSSMPPPMLSPPRRDSASTISSVDSHSLLTVDSVKTHFHRPVPSSSFLLTRSMSSDPSLPSQMREPSFARTASADAIIDASGFAIPMTPPKAPVKSSSQSMLSSSAGSSSRSIDGGKSPLSMPRSPVKLNRRHHCRRCGACFCGEHANDYVALIRAESDQGPTGFQSSSQEQSSREVESNTDGSTNVPKSRNSSRQATFALRDMLEHGRLLSQGTMSEAKAAGIFLGRICKECKGYYELAKTNYVESVRRGSLQDSHLSSPRAATFAAGTQSPRSMSPAPMHASTSTLMGTHFQDDDDDGEAREYHESKERIFREEVREAVEVLKTLRNDQTANRVVAAAVAMGPRSDASALLRRHLTSMNGVRSSSPAATTSRGTSPLPFGRLDPIIASAARSLEPLTRLGKDDEEKEHIETGRQAGANQNAAYTCTSARCPSRYTTTDEHHSAASSTSSRQFKRPRMKTVEEQDHELELRFAAQSTIAMAAGPAPKSRSTRWTWGRPMPAPPEG